MIASPVISLDADSNIIRVAGELTFATVNDVLPEAEKIFESTTNLDIDLSDVTRSDSAGLALLVHWIRAAKNKKKTIVFHNIPSQMRAIADASSLNELLPVQ